MKNKKSTYHQKKDSKLLMAGDCFNTYIKTEYQKITNLLSTTLSQAVLKIDTNQVNNKDLKHQC